MSGHFRRTYGKNRFPYHFVIVPARRPWRQKGGTKWLRETGKETITGNSNISCITARKAANLL